MSEQTMYDRVNHLLAESCCNKYCFYELGWCLYYLLNNRSYGSRPSLATHDRLFANVSGSGLLNNIYNRSHYHIDQTLAISSNILHANAYNYLWGGEGSNVYIQPSEPIDYQAKVIADNKLKDFLNGQKELNDAIRIALKNALDYGSGYVFAIDGEYKPLHPLTIQPVRYKGDTAYVYEEPCYELNDNIQSAIYVFGEVGAISTYLDLPESTRKYFMMRLYRKIDHKKGYDTEKYVSIHRFANRRFLHVMNTPFYEDDLGMPTGCGFKALDSAIQLNRLSDHVFHAQSAELSPPALVTPAVMSQGQNSLSPGTFNIFRPEELGGVPPVAFPSPARGANSANYAEFWRNNIRAAYITGGLAAVGRGQTTASEADVNASSITAMIKNLIRPFDWFVLPLLQDVILKNLRTLNDDSVIDFSTVDLLLLGGPRTADLIERVSLMMNSLQSVASVATALDPSSRLAFNPMGIVLSTLQHNMPSEFFLDNQQLNEAVGAYLQQLQFQTGQQVT